MRGPSKATLFVTQGKAPGRNMRLSDEDRTELLKIVYEAKAAVNLPAAGSRKIIQQLWEGEPVNTDLHAAFVGSSSSSAPDLSSQGRELANLEKNVREVIEGKGSRVPKFAANILQVGTRILATSILPSLPSLQAQAQHAGAGQLEKDQNFLFRLSAEKGGLEQAFRDSIYEGILDTHFGMRADIDPDHEEQACRLQWFAIGAEWCGEEPGLRRFRWHDYCCQFGDLDAYVQGAINRELKKAPTDVKVKGHHLVKVSEIYHGKLRIGQGEGERATIIVSIGEGGLDIYCGTWEVDTCPVVVKGFLRPAPGKVVAYSEAHSWLPPIQMMSEILYALGQDVSNKVRLRLYDSRRINIDDIAKAHANRINGISYVEVSTENTAGAELGVNAAMRPPESDSNLGDILASFNLVWRVSSYIMGISDIDFGDAPSPRKSASEANAITAHLSQRRKERLEVVVSAIREAAGIGMRLQRRAYGKEIKAYDGFTMVVPEYKPGRISLRIDALELGHLALRENSSNLLAYIQLLSNLKQTFPAGIPAMLRGSVAKVATIFGEHDLAATLTLPEYNEDARDRVIDALFVNPGTPIRVDENDDPAVFIPYLTALREKLGPAQRLKSQAVIDEALSSYELLAKKNAASAAPGGEALAPQTGERIPFPLQFDQPY